MPHQARGVKDEPGCFASPGVATHLTWPCSSAQEPQPQEASAEFLTAERDSPTRSRGNPPQPSALSSFCNLLLITAFLEAQHTGRHKGESFIMGSRAASE